MVHFFEKKRIQKNIVSLCVSRVVLVPFSIVERIQLSGEARPPTN